MSTIINSHVSLGHSVVLTMSADVDTYAGLTPEIWASYYQAAYELADQYDIALFDTSMLFRSWTEVTNLSERGDALHPNAVGFDRMARTLARALTN